MRPDTVVIGAGLVGICTALHLQRSGRRVTIVERAAPGSGASGHNAGIFSLGNCVPTATPAVVRSIPRMIRDPLSPLAIRWSYLPRLSPWLLRFVAAGRPARVEAGSMALASLLEQAMKAYEPFVSAGGRDGVLGTGGHVLAYMSDKSFAKAEAALELRSRRGIAFTVLGESGLARLDPLLARSFRRGVHITGAPFTRDPREFTARLAARFVAEDGELHDGEAYDFDLAKGRVRAIRTSTGRIQAESVVIAAGAWSRRLVRRLGLDVPLDTERGYGVDIPDPGLPLTVPFISMDHHVAITPAARGWRLAGTDELAGLSAPPNYERAERLLDVVRLLFPEIGLDGARGWMSHRPSLPDSLPVIGRSPGLTNAYLAFGHGHVGLTLAGITGRMIQEMMDGEAPSVDARPFSPERFALFRSRRGPERGPAR